MQLWFSTENVSNRTKQKEKVGKNVRTVFKQGAFIIQLLFVTNTVFTT